MANNPTGGSLSAPVRTAPSTGSVKSSKSPSSATASVSRTTQNQAKSTPSTASRSVPSGGGARDSGQAANRPSTPMSSQGSSFSSPGKATTFNNMVTGQSRAGNNPSGSLKSFESPKQGGVAGIAGSGIGTLPGPRADNSLYSNAPTVNLGAYVKDQDRVPTYQDLGVAGVPGGMPQRFVVGAPVNPYAGRVFDPSAGANSPFADPRVMGYDQNNPILSTNPIRPPSLGPNERYGGRVMTENERVAQALYGDATLGDVPMPAGRAFNTGVPVFPGEAPSAPAAFSAPAAPLVGISNLANPQNVNAAKVAFANPNAQYTAFNDVTPINPYSDSRYDTAPSYYADISSYRPSAPVRPAGGIAGVAGAGSVVNGRVNVSPNATGTMQPIVGISNLAVPENVYAPGVAFANPNALYTAFNDVAPINPVRPGNVSETVAGQNTTTAYPAANPPRSPFEQARIDAMREQYGLYNNTSYRNEIAEPPPLPNQTVVMGQYQPAPGITSNNTVADIMARYQTPTQTPVSNLVSLSNVANPANDASVIFNNPDARYLAFNDVAPIQTNYVAEAPVPQPTGQTTPTVADILSVYDRPVVRPIAGQAYGPFIDQYSLNDADTLAQQVAETGFPGEPTPYSAAIAQAEAIRRQMAEQPIVADTTPVQEINIPGNDRLNIDNVDPSAPPTDQYVPPVVPGQETPPTSPTERRLAYLQGLGGSGRDSGTYSYPYTQPVLPPEEVVPPLVTPPPAAIDWFNMNRINSPYQTVVPTPLLQTAPVSTGVGSLLPRIVVVNPFA